MHCIYDLVSILVSSTGDVKSRARACDEITRYVFHSKLIDDNEFRIND